MSTSKTEVEVIVFAAIMLHKVNNDFYFLFLLYILRVIKWLKPLNSAQYTF